MSLMLNSRNASELPDVPDPRAARSGGGGGGGEYARMWRDLSLNFEFSTPILSTFLHMLACLYLFSVSLLFRFPLVAILPFLRPGARVRGPSCGRLVYVVAFPLPLVGLLRPRMFRFRNHPSPLPSCIPMPLSSSSPMLDIMYSL